MFIRIIKKAGQVLYDNYFGLIALIVFIMVVFRRLPEATLRLSVLVFAAVFAAIVAADCIISKKLGDKPNSEREIIIAEGLYLCASYYEYMPVMAIVFPALTLLVFPVFFIWGKRWGSPAYAGAHSDEPVETPYAKARRVASYLMGFALILSMLIAGSGGIPLKDNIKNRFVPRGYNTERSYTIENCGKELLKLESWEALSFEQRQELMQLIADVESDYLGLPERLPVNAGICDDDVAACFIPQSYSVTVDKLVMMNSDWQYILHCVLHECYHAYQYQLIALYYESPEEYRTLRPFEHVEDYIWESLNYEDDGSYAYQTQALEGDANYYSNGRRELYLMVIDEMKLA